MTTKTINDGNQLCKACQGRSEKLARNLNEEATRNTKPNTTKITMMLMLNGEIELF